MAKDGTNRGGARIGAGKPQKSKVEKMLEGVEKTSEKQAFSSKVRGKTPKKYLTAEQQDGGEFYAKQIFRETSEWINAHGCTQAVPTVLVEEYSQTVARRIQCEEFLSRYGLLAKHPTTGEPTASPFVKMSIEYAKLASQEWYQISTIVKDNATGNFSDSDDPMEQLFVRRVK